MKSCPFCSRDIDEAASFCRYCGRNLPSPAPTSNGVDPPVENAHEQQPAAEQTEPGGDVVLTDVERLWRFKDDEQLAEAAAMLGEYTDAGQRVIHAELRRREKAVPEMAAPVQVGPHQDAKVSFEVFRGTLASWATLFTEAADFASQLGSERLISISHSADGGSGVVTVWYWS